MELSPIEVSLMHCRRKSVSDNGRRFSAAMHKGNFYGAQFHPEKSGSVGEKILRNFMNL